MDDQDKEHSKESAAVQEAAAGGPQHSMSKDESGSGNVNSPKESVGGPKTPGKPPERMPDHPRDSQSKV